MRNAIRARIVRIGNPRDIRIPPMKTPGEIFTQAAMGVIQEYCEGLPRKINKVATSCLLAASGQNQKLIYDHLVRVVIESEFE